MFSYKLRNHVKKYIPGNLYPHLVNAWGAYRSVIHSGSNVECIICGGHFSTFLPYGQKFDVLSKKNVISGGYRENVICPRCFCSNRERHLYLCLKENTKIFQGERLKLLHIAPEKKLQKIFRSSQNIDYLSADLYSPEAMVKMDIQNINFQDNTFDMIICNHVLEHVPDDIKSLREFYRVLKPGGKVFIEIPISDVLDETDEDPSIELPEEKIRRFGQVDHVRIYGKDFSSRLCIPGFKIQEFNYAKEKGLELALKYGVDPKEKIYIGTKP